jgi:hypothetical protein
MALVRKTWRGVLLWGFVLFVLTGAIIGLLLWGRLTAGTGDIFWLGFTALFEWLAFVALARARIMAARQVMRYQRGEQATVFPVTLPRQVMPLAAGETLTLQRTIDRRSRRLNRWAFVLIALAPLGLALSANGTLLGNLGITMLWSMTTTLQYVNASGFIRNQTITADDAGVHLQLDQQRAVMVPWHEIVAVVRRETRTTAAASDYVIVAQHRVIPLNCYPTGQVLSALSQGRVRYAPQDAVEYRELVERLLATIAKRAVPPIMVKPASRGKWTPPAKLTIEDALALPPAPAHMLAQSLVGATEVTLPLAFQSIPHWGRIWRNALVGTVFIFGFLAIVIVAAGLPELRLLSLMVFVFIALGICVLSFFVAIVIFVSGGTVAERLRYPKFLATEDGLILNPHGRGRTQRLNLVPWTAMQAWFVAPLRNGQRVYTVHSSLKMLTWTDDDRLALQGRGVAGDRRQAYRQQVAALHATIAARTGLVLREQQ